MCPSIGLHSQRPSSSFNRGNKLQKVTTKFKQHEKAIKIHYTPS